MTKERLDYFAEECAPDPNKMHIPVCDWVMECAAEIRASWTECERLRAKCDNLKAALVKRTGASSWEEWAGDWDPTEETPIEYIGRLRKELAEARLIPDAMDQLQRELAEARKDTEYLNWLDMWFDLRISATTVSGSVVKHVEAICGNSMYGNGKDLRAAIDAARCAVGPPQPIECTPGSPCCQDETCPAHRAAASRATKEKPACGA